MPCKVPQICWKNRIATRTTEDYNALVSTWFPCVTADEVAFTPTAAHLKARPGGDMDGPYTLFTIGHSNHTMEDFIAVLKQYGIPHL
jgi:hypothetical protein